VRLPLRLLLASGPALLIGGLGLLHPVFLTPETADRWQLAHYLLLPVFPLLAVSLWVVLRGEDGALAWAARVLALAYAVLYGALDAIAGIGAPEQVREAAQRGAPTPPIGDLYAVGDRLGHLGVVALAGAAVLAGLAVLARTRSPLAPLGAGLVVLASVWFYRHHVFPPRGVLAMVGIAAGLAVMVLAQHRARRPRA
jgi:hypothetical protein